MNDDKNHQIICRQCEMEEIKRPASDCPCVSRSLCSSLHSAENNVENHLPLVTWLSSRWRVLYQRSQYVHLQIVLCLHCCFRDHLQVYLCCFVTGVWQFTSSRCPDQRWTRERRCPLRSTQWSSNSQSTIRFGWQLYWPHAWTRQGMVLSCCWFRWKCLHRSVGEVIARCAREALCLDSWLLKDLLLMHLLLIVGMLDKSTSFVKGFEEKNTDDDKSFWNRSSQVIEVFGQKFLKVRTVEKKITNNSIVSIHGNLLR